MPSFKGFEVYRKKDKKKISYDELVNKHCPERYVPALFDKGDICVSYLGEIIIIGNCDEVIGIPMDDYYIEIPQCDECPVLMGEDAEDFLSEMARVERGEFTEEEIEWRKKFKEFEKEWKKHHKGQWL